MKQSLKALRMCVDFIENVTDDAPDRQERFFECREAWRAAFEAEAAQAKMIPFNAGPLPAQLEAVGPAENPTLYLHASFTLYGATFHVQAVRCVRHASGAIETEDTTNEYDGWVGSLCDLAGSHDLALVELIPGQLHLLWIEPGER